MARRSKPRAEGPLRNDQGVDVVPTNSNHPEAPEGHGESCCPVTRYWLFAVDLIRELERQGIGTTRAAVRTFIIEPMSGRVLGPGVDLQSYPLEVAHYLFNARTGDAATGSAPAELAAAAMRVRMWGVDPDEPHRDALAPGDLVLIYLGAPERVFIGSAELASAVHEWTSSEALLYPGDSPSGVSLAYVDEWDPPVPIHAVLSRIGPSEKAKADFQRGVVRVTAYEMRPPSPWRPPNHQRFEVNAASL